MPHLPTLLRFLILVFSGLASGLACSQGFPSRALSLVVPWPAGGAADAVARMLSKELAPILGQTVLVENLPGAGGSLGIGKALRAPADGHTLMLTSQLDVILAPQSFPSAGYRPEDARAIALLGRTDLMLATRSGLGAGSLAELIAMIKANPDKPLTQCSIGSGTLNHLVGQAFQTLAGVKMLEIPYSGLGPCVTDVIGGQVDVAFLPLAGPFPGFVDRGLLKALVTFGETRNPRFPDLPLAGETSGFEGLSMSVWAGLHVSARVSDEIAAQLHQAAYAALARPELRQAVQSSGATVFDPMSLDQVQAAYLREVKRYRTMAPTAATVRP